MFCRQPRPRPGDSIPLPRQSRGQCDDGVYANRAYTDGQPEGAMGTSDQAFQKIFEQAAVGIAQIALDGTFLRVNERYCQMLGYSEAELLTKTLSDINPPDNRHDVLTGCRE